MTRPNLSEQSLKPVATYKKISTKFSNCAFAVFDKEGNVLRSEAQAACHADLKYIPNNKPSYMITSFTWKTSKALAFKLFDFLKTTMFKKWQDYINLETVIFNKRQYYYVLITDLDKIPSQVVYNLCIWTRVCLEFPDAIKLWDVYCAYGVDPHCALVICRIGFKPRTEKLRVPPYVNQHWPLEQIPDVGRMKRGDADHSENIFGEFPSRVTPCNKIWGAQFDLVDFDGLTVKQFERRLLDCASTQS